MLESLCGAKMVATGCGTMVATAHGKEYFMTEPEHPNQNDFPKPAPNEPVGAAVPPPPPSPYQKPPLPGESSQSAPVYGAPAYPPQPQPPYYGSGQQPPYPPYPGQPPYSATSPQQPKRKTWPWVLAGCLIFLVLGIGGCVSCTACALIADVADDRYGNSYDSYDYGYGDGYRYGYGDSDDSYDPNDDVDFSIDYIKSMLDLSNGTLVEGKYTPGVYEVGASKDIKPGLYYLEGNPTAEADYVVFESTTSERYAVEYGVTYFSNYFVELEEGEVLAWDAGSDLRMYPAADATFTPTAPYQSGLYRVGTDLPAGTYTITIQTDAAAGANNECGAFVMKDLDFDSDSITDTKYVVRGSSQNVTVKDGEWLELYAATATPAA